MDDRTRQAVAPCPQSVTALDVGRPGARDKASDDLYAWFRKHYLWATGSLSINVSELNTHTSDEAIRQCFNAG